MLLFELDIFKKQEELKKKLYHTFAFITLLIKNFLSGYELSYVRQASGLLNIKYLKRWVYYHKTVLNI